MNAADPKAIETTIANFRDATGKPPVPIEGADSYPRCVNCGAKVEKHGAVYRCPICKVSRCVD
jgi:hypothetical protein